MTGAGEVSVPSRGRSSPAGSCSPPAEPPASCQWPCSADQTLPEGGGPGGGAAEAGAPLPAEPSASCQWPCSVDQTLPGGTAPPGWGAGPPAPGARSCQWRCSSDQTLPAGAGPGGPGLRFAQFISAITKPAAMTRAPIPAAACFHHWVGAVRPSQHCLYLRPLPQPQRSFRPGFIAHPVWSRSASSAGEGEAPSYHRTPGPGSGAPIHRGRSSASPVMGTKRTGMLRSRRMPFSERVRTRSSWSIEPTGMTMRPPGAS